MSFSIFDSHINYANLVWAQNWNAMSRILTLQKRLWELLLFNQGIAIQALYFWNLNYLNSMMKSFLKMCFWSVNLSMVSCQQSSAIGSLFALIFITMRQLHLLFVNYLKLSALTYMEKIELQQMLLMLGVKLKLLLTIPFLRIWHPIKLKQ